jgi:hypothetical protein
LFDKFVQGLPEEEAAKKKEELKNRFWTRVVELKQNQEPGQIFPEVSTAPETPSQKTAKEGEVPTTYKDSVQKFREAAERGMSEDMGMIRDEIVTQLTSEPTIESLTQALAGIKSVFIETDLDKVISDLQQNKTESLVEFLEEAGATPKEINSIVSKLPKAEKKETKTQETKETKTAKETKADIEKRRVDIISRKSTPQEKFEFLESIPEGTIFKNEDDVHVIFDIGSCHALESVEFAKKYNIQTITVYTCDYNIVKYYQKHYYHITLKCQDIFVAADCVSDAVIEPYKTKKIHKKMVIDMNKTIIAQ